jgi:predicted dehydrogenase
LSKPVRVALRSRSRPEPEADTLSRRVGIIINGATGGLARHQHLAALLALRAEGGLVLSNGDRLVPELMLVGRNDERLRTVAAQINAERWTTDLDGALSDQEHDVFFDAAATAGRFSVVRRAIRSGKHVYCEKPVASTLQEATELVCAARDAGVKNGTVQDKIFLPGFRKLKMLRDSGFFGRVLEVRLEFGRWIFDGEQQRAQRPSWNYRKADGGGLILDMFPHWRYMIEHFAGKITAVNCTCRTHIARRRDEGGRPYAVDVEDSAFAHMELEGGAIATVNSSWCTRIRRDDIIVAQIDGTRGSAVATPHDCWTQSDVNTPSPVISVGSRQPQDFYAQWLAVPDNSEVTNSYRAGWELFLRHVADDEPFAFTLLEGAKGVQLAELSYRANAERRWIDVPALNVGAPATH